MHNTRFTFLALTAIWFLSTVFTSYLKASETNASILINHNNKIQYNKWTGLSIPELSEIGNRAINIPDSFPKAIQAFTAIVSRYEGQAVESRDYRAVVSAMNNLGYVYTFHYLDYQKGIRYLNTALELAESKDIKDLIPVICLNLGAIYSLNQLQFSDMAFADKSMEVYAKGLKTAEEIKDWKNHLKLFNNIICHTISHSSNAFPQKIIDSFPLSSDDVDNDMMYPFTREHFLAYKAMKNNDTDMALRHYSTMENLTTGVQDEIRYKLMAITEKAILYEDHGNLPAALSETIRAIEIAKKYNYSDIPVFLYDDARRLYAKSGDNANAEKYHILYLKQKDSIFNACQMKAVSEFQFRQEMDKMEDTVRDLSYHKKIQNVYLWVLGIFSALATLFALHYNYSNRRLRQRNQSLYQKNLSNIEAENRNFNLQKENDELHAELERISDKTVGTQPSNGKEKYSYSLLDEERKVSIHQKMTTIIEEDRDVFSQDFSLGMLAEKIECPQSYLSQVISEKTGKNFYTILGERRIKEACRIMANSAKSHLSIEGVASEVGIRSRSNFTTLFKKYTGLTPGEFIRQSRKFSKVSGSEEG